MAIILERQGIITEGVRRHTFEGDSILLGRGYHNHLMLHDPYVCASHGRLFCQDEQWYIEDLASSNGIYMDKQKKPINGAQRLASGDRFRIGKTSFRFLLPDHPVRETLLFARQSSLLGWCAKPLHIILLIVLFFTLQMLSYYFSHLQFDAYAALSHGFEQALLFFVLLIVFLSISIPIVGHISKVAIHIGMTMLIACGMTMADGLTSYLIFNSNKVWLSEWLGSSLNFVLWWLLFHINARLAAPHTALWKILLGIAIPLVIVAYSVFDLIHILDEPDQSDHDRASFNAALLPPFANIAPAEEVNRFIQRSNDLFTDSAKDAAEKL
ncbi:MAG: FHA domain-containing protein, partial [Mariprofundaceae bacterium]|nr:FHA domain-containing protein [Mariprofundaceae bacterium]